MEWAETRKKERHQKKEKEKKERKRLKNTTQKIKNLMLKDP